MNLAPCEPPLPTNVIKLELLKAPPITHVHPGLYYL